MRERKPIGPSLILASSGVKGLSALLGEPGDDRRVIVNHRALALRATAELGAFVAREIDVMIDEARAGLSKDDVIMRLQGLRRDRSPPRAALRPVKAQP